MPPSWEETFNPVFSLLNDTFLVFLSLSLSKLIWKPSNTCIMHNNDNNNDTSFNSLSRKIAFVIAPNVYCQAYNVPANNFFDFIYRGWKRETVGECVNFIFFSRYTLLRLFFFFFLILKSVFVYFVGSIFIIRLQRRDRDKDIERSD